MSGIFQKEKTQNKVVLLPIQEIVANPSQPRREFDLRELEGLALSIKENGVLQPITVRKNDDKKYELISGERRLRASKKAGFEEIPAIVVDATERQSAIYAILENIQRKDLTIFEEALALRCLINEWGVTQEEASEKLGKAQSTIANKLRLLSLSNVEQEIIIRNQLTERHARALLKVKDENLRVKILKKIVKRGLNVSETDRYIEKATTLPVKKGKRCFIVKDIRIFINTINKAIDVMKSAGIDAETSKQENDGYIEYLVRIPTRPK